MALANHRKTIHAEIGAGVERIRQAQLQAVTRAWARYGLDEEDLTPAALLFVITGVAASDLPTPSRAAECLDLLARHGVVIYREAHIGDNDLVAFSRLLGDVVPNPTGEHELPEIATITLDPARTDATLAWYRQGNFLWHIDGATDQQPQKATLLTAQPQFVLRHRWRTGDLVIWDNTRNVAPGSAVHRHLAAAHAPDHARR